MRKRVCKWSVIQLFIDVLHDLADKVKKIVHTTYLLLKLDHIQQLLKYSI